jgi:hypothetical protein
MRQKIVGTYRLGDEMVQLVLREGGGADFYTTPGDIPNPRMKIGADRQSLDWLIDSVQHEAQEHSMSILRLRFLRGDSYYVDSTAYVFMLDHEEFTEVCHRAAMFLGDCLPDLKRAWAKWKKGKK